MVNSVISRGVSSSFADTLNTCQGWLHAGLSMKEMPLPQHEIVLGYRHRVVWLESEANRDWLHLPVAGHTSSKTRDPAHLWRNSAKRQLIQESTIRSLNIQQSPEGVRIQWAVLHFSIDLGEFRHEKNRVLWWHIQINQFLIQYHQGTKILRMIY